MAREQRAAVLEAKRRFWQQHVERWERSGQSQAAYCRQHDLKLHCFIYWRGKYRRAKRGLVSLVEVQLPRVAGEAIRIAGHRPLRLLVSEGHRSRWNVISSRGATAIVARAHRL